jgi:hypothetical protein
MLRLLSDTYVMEIMLEIGIAVSTLSSFYESIGTGERYRETHFKLRHKKNSNNEKIKIIMKGKIILNILNYQILFK